MLQKIKMSIQAGIASLLIVSLLACSASAASIISLIDTGLQIAVQAASVTGTLPVAYSNYVQAGLTCINFAATEIATTDPPAIQTGKVVQACASAVDPTLPPGTPANLVNMASQMAVQIATIIQSLEKVAPPAQPTVVALAKGAKAPSAAQVVKAPVLTVKQIAHLAVVKAQIAAALADVKARTGK